MNAKRQVKAKAAPAKGPIGRRPRRSPRAVFWSVVLVLGCLGALGVVRVSTRVAVLDSMYRLSKAQSEHDKLANELEKLQLENAALAATARVDREAHRSLGLSPAPPERTVFVSAQPEAPEATALAANGS